MKKKILFFLIFLVSTPGVSFCNDDFPWDIFIPVITMRHNAQVVGPSGGTLEFANGLILRVPPGALTKSVAISLSTLDCDAVEPIIQAPVFSSLNKRCLFGFVGKPEGLTFAIPATVTIPVSSLATGETVILTEIDEGAGTYKIIDADLVFRGQDGVVDVSIEHFSSKGLIAGKSKIKQNVWSDKLPDCCNTENNVPIPADCCCNLFESIQREGDIQSGENCQDCQIVGSSLRTIFPLCPGKPEALDEVSESTDGCPEDLRAVIQSTDSEIWICQDMPLEARLLGTNNDGSECNLPLTVDWALTANSANASLTPKGPSGAVLRGLSPGSATVEATSTIDSKERITKDITFQTISGDWLEKYPDWSETCTMEDIDGEPYSWVETSGPDQSINVLEQTCTATSNTLSSRPKLLPSSPPFTGTLVETGNPVSPFSFSLSVASSNSPDCQVFMSSNGIDIFFGEPICPPDATCTPISCFESESGSGTFSSAKLARSYTSEATGHFEATWEELRIDEMTGEEERVTRSITCEGKTTSSGQKQ